MFEKHRSNKPESRDTQPQQDNFAVPASASVSSGKLALLGPGIHVNGEISGDEDLLVEGRVDGKIRLDLHEVEVGQSGRVNADIRAKVIKISGEVRGDIIGTEKVVILRSGNVHGNIVAPRMTLEDGAIFKGSIDMDPGESAKPKVAEPVKKTEVKSNEKVAEKPKAVASGGLKDNKGYSLNGG